jgi:hypothetical protein
MIIWWTGRGLLAMPIMLASFTFPLIGAVMLNEANPNRVPMSIIPFSMVVGWGFGGTIVRVLGRRWNRDARPGEYHTLYSIRVERWGLVCIILATILGALLVVASIGSLFR